MSATAVDLFCGAGGASTGLALLGFDVLGVEWDEAAAATHDAAGHRTMIADIGALTPDDLPGDALLWWISAPCTAFSNNGKRAGQKVADDLAHAARTRDWGWGRDEHDPAVWLSLASMELCLARRPEVVVWENVPQVAPLYDALEKVYAEEGYSVDQWVLDAETFGIPQTRQRRFLVARANYFVPNAPEPTHRRWVHPRYEARRAEADAIDAAAGRRPWVSMGEALGVDSDVVALNTGRRWKKGGTRDDAQTTPLTEPSPTVSTLTCSQWQWRLRRHAGGDAWDWPSPITTRDSRGCSVSIAEAARLQTFPDNHPWVGSKAEVTMQIGNAVPPALAGFVAAHAASLPTEPVEDYLDVLLGTPIPQEVSA